MFESGGMGKPDLAGLSLPSEKIEYGGDAIFHCLEGAVQRLHFANNVVRIRMLGSI